MGTKILIQTKELTQDNVSSLIGDTQLIVDAFDNSVSRQVLYDYAAQTSIPCLHAGLASDYAEVIWNETYQVPSNAQDDFCDYPLARNLVVLVVAVIAEVIISWIATDQKRNFTLTLKDLQITSF